MRRNGLHLYALGVAILLAVAPPVGAVVFGASCLGGEDLRLRGAGRSGNAGVGGGVGGGAAARVCRGKAGNRPAATPERSYKAARQAVAVRLRRLSGEYRQASGGTRGRQRERVVARAGRLLQRALERHLMPHWCGTPWAFHGTSQQPRRGHIACGYFVSTLLRDAGLRVQRVAMARRPAEAIIRSLVSERHMRRFSDAPIRRFVDRVRRMGTGLYIVGLDNHVGFLLVTGGRVTFVHSTYLKPTCVAAEDAVSSPALVASRYRVVGKLTADADLLHKWLTRTRIATR